MIPAALVKQYLYHENFKDELKSWLDKFVADGNNCRLLELVLCLSKRSYLCACMCVLHSVGALLFFRASSRFCN